MKNIWSLIACFLISAVLLQQRLHYSDVNGKELKVTTWDALGYYMYLPAIGLYNDTKELKWFHAIDSSYKVSGGWFYQAGKAGNGNYVFKYLGGVALLQAPFFVAAHIYASYAGYPADGFSEPYQYAIAFGALFYCIVALLLLRRILLLYFSDVTSATTLLLLVMATNFVQYASVDGAMSHAWIFPLYVLVLYCTIKWHESPKLKWAFLIGYIIGLATVCRPTELVMLFIPLFWNTHTKSAAKEKWRIVKENKPHIYAALLGGLLGVLPQLIYWQHVTGSFVHDVGSKWDFLTPHLRVLFGWEKGWFIYTPVTLLFIAGMFFMKGYAFRRSVLWFCLLNIYVIIAWSDWRYGGSYAARALVQSYPVFALPLACVVERVNVSKWKYVLLTAGVYLIAVNIFQVGQYNRGVLHYNDMNRKYYGRIYLNANPTPLDMSLMDTEDFLADTTGYNSAIIADIHPDIEVTTTPEQPYAIKELAIPACGDGWLRVDANVTLGDGWWGSVINTLLIAKADTFRNVNMRLNSPAAKKGPDNMYSFYVRIPADVSCNLILGFKTQGNFAGRLNHIRITLFCE